MFETLPGASTFIVNGAPLPSDSVLTTAGAELRFASGLAVGARFEGQFANGFATYGGRAIMRYQW